MAGLLYARLPGGGPEAFRRIPSNTTSELDLGPMERGEYSPKRVVLSIRLDASDDIDLVRLARRMGADKSTLSQPRIPSTDQRIPRAVDIRRLG